MGGAIVFLWGCQWDRHGCVVDGGIKASSGCR